MARIRTIKPEILEDEKTARLSDGASRLFHAVIVLADDHGFLRGAAGWLRGQVYWARPEVKSEDVEDQLAELAAVELVIRYEVDGQQYLAIKNWSKHQRISNAGKPRCPPPPQVRGGSRRNAEGLGETPLDHDHDHRTTTTTAAAETESDPPQEQAITPVQITGPRERWTDGPLSSRSDCIDAWENWQWCNGTSVPDNARGAAKRVTDAGAITPEEWFPAKAAAEARKPKGHLRPAYFLGVVERRREELAGAERKTSPPPVAAVVPAAWGRGFGNTEDS